MKVKSTAILIGVGLMLGSAQVYAAPAVETTFEVKISITPMCNIGGGTTALDFGPNDSFQADVLGQTNLTVTCTKGAAYEIKLDEGMSAGTLGDVDSRRMHGTAGAVNENDYIPYQLFRNSERTQAWGITSGQDTLNATGTGATQTHIVYGKVPGTNFTVGNYSDTITATVTF